MSKEEMLKEFKACLNLLSEDAVPPEKAIGLVVPRLQLIYRWLKDSK